MDPALRTPPKPIRTNRGTVDHFEGIGIGRGWFETARMTKLSLEAPIKLNQKYETRDEIRSAGENPESGATSLKLASLAAAWLTQDRELKVRQREELRRALNRVAEIRTWVASETDPPTTALQDVEDFTQTGLRLIQKELRDELADKKKEVSRLKKVAEALKDLAGTDGWEDPVEVSYSHTVRQADGLATQTDTLTLVDTGEAEEAAAAFEKKLDNWEKLRSQMQDDLERRKRDLKEVAKFVSAFAASSETVVVDVLDIIKQTG